MDKTASLRVSSDAFAPCSPPHAGSRRAQPRRLRHWIAVAVAACALSASAASAQLISHTFEDGTVQGWSPRGAVTLTSSTEAARTGSRSLKTAGRTAAWNGPALDLRSRLAPNTTYQISGWVRLAAGQPSSNLKFTVERVPSGGSASYIQVNAAEPVTDGAWVLLQGNYSFTTADNSTHVLYLESNDATSSYHLDDFTVTVLSAPGCPEPHDQSGLATDFEAGSTQGWTGRGSASVAVTTDAAQAGVRSLSVTGRSASWQGASINTLCKLHKGSKYLVSVWARLLPGEAPAQLRVSLQARFNGADSYHTVVGNTPVTDGAWVLLQTEYTFGLDAEQLQLYVESASGTASFYLDEFLLVHLPPAQIEKDIPSLHEVLAGYFPVGAAIEPVETTGAHGELLQKHFNLVVAGNAMKWSSLQPTEGNFNFGPADTIANFARTHGLRMRGHTLVWHNQTPAWVFRDAAGQPLEPGNPDHRALLLSRLETHIHTVVTRYRDIVDSWDVVNEVIDATQPNGLRVSPWLQIIGPEFIDWAFEYAREVAGDGRLFLNDYNTHETLKRTAMQNLLQGLLARDVPVDGVGHQMHINIASPSVDSMRQTIELFAGMGLLTEITEMDVSVYTNSTDTSAVTPEQIVRQGYRYRDVFNLYRELAPLINSVTLWGLADDNTWLKTFPITRDDQPLLFDAGLQSKPAYWGVVDPSRLPVVPKDLTVTAGSPVLAANADPLWQTLARQPLTTNTGTDSWASFRAFWKPGTLTLSVTVLDPTREPGDRVEIFLAGREPFVFQGFGRQKKGGADALITPINGGYQLEVALPAVQNLAPGAEVVMDVRVTDAGTGAQLSWSDTTHQQDGDSTRYGTLHLAPAKHVATVTRGTPVIDAIEDGVWRHATEVTTSRFVLGSAGATARVKLLWDATHLYILATVSDPLLSKASANAWEEDSIEVFIDQNNAQTMTYQADDAQYRINYDNEASFAGAARPALLSSATRQVAGGYIVEAAFTLDAVTLSAGRVVGFDLQVNDDGAGNGVRTSVATWNDTTGNAYRDPSQFGVLRLVNSGQSTSN